MAIQIGDKKFKVSITGEKIQSVIREIADELNAELSAKDVVFVGILNGSFMFATDLFKRIDFPAQITFLKVSSYEGTKSSGKVTELIGLDYDIKGKTVVIVEDIIDSGLTMTNIIKQLKAYEPEDIKVATLLLKPDAFKADFMVDYIGLEIPNKFIVGYGLDYNGFGRNSRDIYALDKDGVSDEITKIKHIVLFGAPGAGKGTQSKKIIEKYNLVHFSTGDMLRAEIESNTRLGQIAKRHMQNGGLVPDEIILGMISKKLETNKGTQGFVFDGFPRTVEQAKGLDYIMQKKNMLIAGMFALDVSLDELKRRLIERGKSGSRKDDTPKIIDNRIKIYHKKTRQVAEYYKEQKKFHLIYGEGEINNIFKDIDKIYQTL